MLAEARRVKEQLCFRPAARFQLAPSTERSSYDAFLPSSPTEMDLVQEDLRALLDRRGLYRLLSGALGRLLRQSTRYDIDINDIEEVLLVGGSTLLPGIQGVFERFFRPEQIHAWRPFEAVAHGAASFAADDARASDLLAHDYALVERDPATGASSFKVVLPHGVRAPTDGAAYSAQIEVPVPGSGPVDTFSLEVSEVGLSERERSLAWGAGAQLRRAQPVDSLDERIAVSLNRTQPLEVPLRPPARPGDKGPRLEVSLAVGRSRHVHATVRDLATGKLVVEDEPVVRAP